MINKYIELSFIIEGVNNLFVVIDWKIIMDVFIDVFINNIRINFLKWFWNWYLNILKFKFINK